jgi:hypothetical protein
VRGTAIGGKLGPAVCPGYTIRLPEVQDVARFWAWEKRGVVELHARERALRLSSTFLDLTDVFAGEAALAERFESEERIEQAKRRK